MGEGDSIITWTIDHYHKKDRRRKVTVNLEGKLTSGTVPKYTSSASTTTATATN